jgi:hypothetical protein
LGGHTLMALLTVWVMCHLTEPHPTEPIIIVHMQPILTVLMALAEDLAWAEDLAEAEDLAGAEEEDGGKLDNWHWEQS